MTGKFKKQQINRKIIDSQSVAINRVKSFMNFLSPNKLACNVTCLYTVDTIIKNKNRDRIKIAIRFLSILFNTPYLLKQFINDWEI